MTYPEGLTRADIAFAAAYDFRPIVERFRAEQARAAVEIAFAGSRFMAALTWERDERPKWEGRNWRRLKRECRRYMKARVARGGSAARLP